MTIIYNGAQRSDLLFTPSYLHSPPPDQIANTMSSLASSVSSGCQRAWKYLRSGGTSSLYSGTKGPRVFDGASVSSYKLQMKDVGKMLLHKD